MEESTQTWYIQGVLYWIKHLRFKIQMHTQALWADLIKYLQESLFFQFNILFIYLMLTPQKER